MRDGYVYIASNNSRSTLYIGVTNNLQERIFQHRSEIGSKFIQKYKCFDLIYYEHFKSIEYAIEREKQLKNWHRKWKMNLIKEFNPELRDLYDNI